MILKGEIQIGGSINVRTEKHGDENVAAMDIPCSMLIRRKQLNELLREDAADSLLFKSQNQEHFEPVFAGKFGPIPVLGKFEKSAVEFRCGLDLHEINFEECSISKLKIEPQTGGMTLFRFTVQAHLTDAVKAIFDWANTAQAGTIKTGKFSQEAAAQSSLPLGEPIPDAAENADIPADIPKPKSKKRVKRSNGAVEQTV